MKRGLYIVFFLITFSGLSQQKKIEIIHSDQTFVDEEKYPEAIVGLGNVVVAHEGAVLECQQALIYQKENIIKAFGDVYLNQGDTIIQTSKYVHYDGKTKTAKSWGNVVLKDTKMTLTTDTLHFDRTNQLLFYRNNATIKDSVNNLKSEIGKYFLKEKKFQGLSKVVITSPESKVTSEHLEYFTDTGISYLYGPSTIEDPDNTLYCENGFHNSKTKISHFTKNAKITYKDRIIKGDSLYYDENRAFASATGNIIMTDTINNMIIKGGYAEYFETKDSVFIVQKPVAISLMEKDSMYIHGDTLLVTGKIKKRILRAYHHVKFFKSDLQGKCDSMYSNQALGISKMYRRPIMWNEKNQITGDSIYFISKPDSEILDSLKVYQNAFIAQRDSTGGFNQTKGKNIYAKFIDGEIDNLIISGNGQMINYNRNEEKELIAISKMICSNIVFKMRKGELQSINYKVKPEGKTYPPLEFPEEEKELPGFLWREAERPLSKEDIFKHDKGDDTLINAIIVEEKAAKKEALETKRQKEALKEKMRERHNKDTEKPKGKPVNREEEKREGNSK